MEQDIKFIFLLIYPTFLEFLIDDCWINLSAEFKGLSLDKSTYFLVSRFLI